MMLEPLSEIEVAPLEFRGPDNGASVADLYPVGQTPYRVRVMPVVLCDGGDCASPAEVRAVATEIMRRVNAHAGLVEQARQRDALLALLERAIDDQRHVETAQGIVEWFEEAVDIVAELRNLPRPRRGFKFSDEETLNAPQN